MKFRHALLDNIIYKKTRCALIAVDLQLTNGKHKHY